MIKELKTENHNKNSLDNNEITTGLIKKHPLDRNYRLKKDLK